VTLEQIVPVPAVIQRRAVACLLDILSAPGTPDLNVLLAASLICSRPPGGITWEQARYALWLHRKVCGGAP